MKVLIIEDDKVSCKKMQTIVAHQGHKTKTAKDGVHGLELYNKFKPDLIFADIQMPNMSGLEFLSTIRQTDNDVIIIINTAFGSEEYALKAFHLNANNYISKPIHFSEVLHHLKKYEAIIQERTLNREIEAMFIKRSYKLQVPNKIEQIPRVVDHLLTITGDAICQEEQLGVRLGLVELIVNAVEHGNMGITYDEKNKAINHNRLDDLYQERLDDPEIAARRVKINFELSARGCEWMITDEGDGFDWKAIPDPTKGEKLRTLIGRGIFLSRFYFDELEFIGTGNIIRIFKLKSVD
ncbi:response regulator [Desulfococcaceae bacterium HSG7]|nr:response regulator [Desulfococcaceae bacterium HSG9]MDM8555132.1 response regulator [Desulfococcaceae bacterium HSG7]